MADLLILPVGLIAGIVVWTLFCGVANWIGTGRFRGERRG
jgi:hypothetical protein